MSIETPSRAIASLYGPSGWTRTGGAADLLAPLVCEPRFTPDFARFAGVGALEASALLDLLPAANLHDRQNNGPELRELLDAAQDREGIELSGYLIGPPRWDERVSVDGILVPFADDLPVGALGDPLVYAHWPAVREALGLTSARGLPDEFHPVAIAPAQGARMCAWWIWWD